MVASDDVAVEAIMEFVYSILHLRNHINSNTSKLLYIQSYAILSSVISNMSLHTTKCVNSILHGNNFVLI